MPEAGGWGFLKRNDALQGLLVLARRVVQDGEVTGEEADEFSRWLAANPDMSGVWPVRDLTRHFRALVADGSLCDRDRTELLGLLRDLVGEGSHSKPEEWGKLDRPRDR